MFASNSFRRSFQIHDFSTSSIFANNFLIITINKCRRRISNEKNALFDKSRDRIRKRQRNQNVKNAEEANEKRSIKIRFTHTCLIRQLRTRPTKRLRID